MNDLLTLGAFGALGLWLAPKALRRAQLSMAKQPGLAGRSAANQIRMPMGARPARPRIISGRAARRPMAGRWEGGPAIHDS